MKVFISWSGTKSQEVAKILKQWIPCVIQSVDPYFSSADIDKGARWSTDIAKELKDASFGILCVTKENLSSSWLNFEAGALSKSIEQSKVCPFLIDLKPSEINNSPILQFQMASSSKDDVWKLFTSINSNLGDMRLNEDVLCRSFETFWPKIDEALKSVSSIAEVTGHTKDDKIDTQAPIEEILELVRYQHKLLKSPEELLPPQYIYDVFRKSNRMLSRNLLVDIDEQIHAINMLASEMLSACAMDLTSDANESVAESPSCISKIQEIYERTRSLGRMIRAYRRNPDSFY